MIILVGFHRTTNFIEGLAIKKANSLTNKYLRKSFTIENTDRINKNNFKENFANQKHQQSY